MARGWVQRVSTLPPFEKPVVERCPQVDGIDEELNPQPQCYILQVEALSNMQGSLNLPTSKQDAHKLHVSEQLGYPMCLSPA